jgi:hypothetical protein
MRHEMLRENLEETRAYEWLNEAQCEVQCENLEGNRANEWANDDATA